MDQLSDEAGLVHKMNGSPDALTVTLAGPRPPHLSDNRRRAQQYRPPRPSSHTGAWPTPILNDCSAKGMLAAIPAKHGNVQKVVPD